MDSQLSAYGNKIIGRVNAKIKWKANVCKQTRREKNTCHPRHSDGYVQAVCIAFMIFTWLLESDLIAFYFIHVGSVSL